jgi:hypothetical protein
LTLLMFLIVEIRLKSSVPFKMRISLEIPPHMAIYWQIRVPTCGNRVQMALDSHGLLQPVCFAFKRTFKSKLN